MRRALLAFGLALPLAVCAPAPGAVTVPWQQAADHVGQQITIEGDVVAARLEGPTCVIEFAPSDTKAFRVVLLIPLITDLPRNPERLYQGKRIRASGTVRRFAGRPEMILRTPDAIEVIDLAHGTTVASTSTTRPTGPTIIPVPSTMAPPPGTPTTTLPEAGVAPAIPSLPLPAWPLRDTCEAARERWREAAAVARERATALARCLEGDSYRCSPMAAALAPALTALEWAEQQVEAACR